MARLSRMASLVRFVISRGSGQNLMVPTAALWATLDALRCRGGDLPRPVLVGVAADAEFAEFVVAQHHRVPPGRLAQVWSLPSLTQRERGARPGFCNTRPGYTPPLNS
jgi:hypothetical protein